MMDSKPLKLALIGERIAHSRSPAIHNAFAAHHNLLLDYSLLPTPPSELAATIDSLRGGEWRGANITTPYKEEVCALLDALDPECERIGAVNTIVVERNGMLRGCNTDIAGVAFVLRDEPVVQSSYTAAVIGTGGAARAAVEALLADTNLQSLVLYSRSAERARSIAARWNDTRVQSGALDTFAPVDIVIHATPLGMTESEAVLETSALRGTNVLVEMIYAPAVTELMRRAQRAGVRTTGGMGMLMGQALESFRLWTGIEPQLGKLPDEVLDDLHGCSVLWK